MIISDNSTTGQLTIGSSEQIDFALWVLLQDGLRVAPFDKHAGGNEVLQSLGMTAENWYSWLKLMMVRHDGRLVCHVPNIKASSEERVESFRQILDARNEEHNIVCDQGWHDGQYNYYSQLLTEQEQLYQQAIADYQELDLNFIRENEPPQLWQGSSQIKEALAQLWDDYSSIKDKDPNKFIDSILVTPKMWDVEANPPTDKYLQIYLVNYPYEVEIFMEPIFVIVTLPNSSVDLGKLDQRMFKAIQSIQTVT